MSNFRTLLGFLSISLTLSQAAFAGGPQLSDYYACRKIVWNHMVLNTGKGPSIYIDPGLIRATYGAVFYTDSQAMFVPLAIPAINDDQRTVYDVQITLLDTGVTLFWEFTQYKTSNSFKQQGYWKNPNDGRNFMPVTPIALGADDAESKDLISSYAQHYLGDYANLLSTATGDAAVKQAQTNLQIAAGACSVKGDAQLTAQAQKLVPVTSTTPAN